MPHLLSRLKPDPLPRVRPVPENQATGALKSIYQDTKTVLRVPWMGVVTMCFAQYPHFYETLWSGLRPLANSAEFEAACADLVTQAEQAALALPCKELSPALIDMGYGPADLDAIRYLIQVFHTGNMPYLLLATLARLLLEGQDLSDARQVTPLDTPPPPPGALLLMEPHHADAPTRLLYEDIKATLGLPVVNTDYRALARWPSYFSEAWGALKPVVTGTRYESEVTALHDACVKWATTLPNAGRLDSEALRNAALKDAPVQEVLDVVRLFQWLLPGLAVNVAVFREQLS